MVLTIILFLARWYKVGIMTTYIQCYTQHQTEFYYQLVNNSTIITRIVSKLRIKLCLSEYILDSLIILSGFYTSKYILDGRLKKLTRELSPSRLGFVTLEEHTKQQGADEDD